MKEDHPSIIYTLFCLIIDIGAAGGLKALHNAGVRNITQAHLDRLTGLTTVQLKNLSKIVTTHPRLS
ncbi:MAG: hypothetical protein M3A44_07820 [Gammaproteobacteria bacterium]